MDRRRAGAAGNRPRRGGAGRLAAAGQQHELDPAARLAQLYVYGGPARVLARCVGLVEMSEQAASVAGARVHAQLRALLCSVYGSADVE